MADTINLHGRPVPAADYETLRRLEHTAFGLTPADWPDGYAHGQALNAAIIGLRAMRAAIRSAIQPRTRNRKAQSRATSQE